MGAAGVHTGFLIWQVEWGPSRTWGLQAYTSTLASTQRLERAPAGASHSVPRADDGSGHAALGEADRALEQVADDLEQVEGERQMLEYMEARNHCVTTL